MIEKLKKTGEDSHFFYKAVKNGVKIAMVKEARVVWFEPGRFNLKDFFKKVSSYAYGDVKTKIFWHPTKGILSHNIKIILVFVRYFLFLFLFYLFFSSFRLYFWAPFLFLFYIFWPIYKWRDVLKERKERLYLPLVQGLFLI